MPHPPVDQLTTPGQWALAIFSIILIDIVLAGDNAVVIALAVRSLPPKQRRWGIILGAGAAVLLRVVLTYFAAQLMHVSFVKLVGGLLILWIAVKLLLQANEHDPDVKEAHSLSQAVWLIIIADITMSLDNVLAVAGASKNNNALLLFGLGLSIPLVVAASNLLSSLMNRYPAIVIVGAALLGKVGGEMIMEDPFTHNLLHPAKWIVIAVEIALAGGVLLVAHLIKTRRKAAA